MKKLTNSGFAGIATAAVLAAAAFASTANAQLISLSLGDYTIAANGYSSTALPSNLFVTPGAAPGEDTWGIFQINNIVTGANSANTQVVYTEGQAPAAGYFQYYGVFYGSHDVSATPSSQGFDFISQGLHLDIYALNVNDVSNAYWSQVFNQGASPAARVGGPNGYHLITDVGGSLVFSASALGNTGGSYNSTFNTTFNTGNLGVTFNNLFSIPPGTALTSLTYALSGTTINVPSTWNDAFGGPITGNVVPVPEPSTYGLMAAGALLGLVAFRRMKVRAQAV